MVSADRKAVGQIDRIERPISTSVMCVSRSESRWPDRQGLGAGVAKLPRPVSADRKAVGQIDTATAQSTAACCSCQPIGKPLARSTQKSSCCRFTTRSCQPIGKPLARSTFRRAIFAAGRLVSADRKAVGQIDRWFREAFSPDMRVSRSESRWPDRHGRRRCV